MADKKALFRIISLMKDDSGQFVPFAERYEDAVVDPEHWKQWKRFDKGLGGDATFSTMNGSGYGPEAYRYTTTSPMGNEKRIYERFFGDKPQKQQVAPTIRWNNKLKPEGFGQ